jgi:predicted dehydrogenase
MSIAAAPTSPTPGRIRYAMIGGGIGAFIGATHRLAARLDDRFELVAGALSSGAARAAESGLALGLDPARCYADFREMARAEVARPDGARVAVVVTPNHLHAPAAVACLEAGLDVICDKPLAGSLEDAQAIAKAQAASGRRLFVTYTYSGYPMAREARARVRAGELGAIRSVQVEYAQDWLAARAELTGNKQAQWRTDPARSGLGGAMGDIGAHAFHLVEFVTGLRVAEVLCEATALPGRALDDEARALLRFEGGARGALWASQIAAGEENALTLRVYGEKAGLEWRQEDPNRLKLAPIGGPATILTRASMATSAESRSATRIPPGHPEGYFEAFATLYRDVADVLSGAEATLAPQLEDGLRGVAFIAAAIGSAKDGGVWRRIEAK